MLHNDIVDRHGVKVVAQDVLCLAPHGIKVTVRHEGTGPPVLARVPAGRYLDGTLQGLDDRSNRSLLGVHEQPHTSARATRALDNARMREVTLDRTGKEVSLDRKSVV